MSILLDRPTNWANLSHADKLEYSIKEHKGSYGDRFPIGIDERFIDELKKPDVIEGLINLVNPYSTLNGLAVILSKYSINFDNSMDIEKLKKINRFLITEKIEGITMQDVIRYTKLWKKMNKRISEDTLDVDEEEDEREEREDESEEDEREEGEGFIQDIEMEESVNLEDDDFGLSDSDGVDDLPEGFNPEESD